MGNCLFRDNKIYPIKINQDVKKKYSLNECKICFSSNNNDSIYLPCGHNFHTNCILDWFETSLDCPICREEVEWIIDKNIK